MAEAEEWRKELFEHMSQTFADILADVDYIVEKYGVPAEDVRAAVRNDMEAWVGGLV